MSALDDLRSAWRRASDRQRELFVRWTYPELSTEVDEERLAARRRAEDRKLLKAYVDAWRPRKRTKRTKATGKARAKE